MKLVLKDGLPFISVEIVFDGQSIVVTNVLVDTGSATTLISIDAVAPLGLTPRPGDPIRRLRGVGGVEYVFAREVENIRVDEIGTGAFEIELGGLDYGFEIDGILGMDFLLRTKAVVDLDLRVTYFGSRRPG